MREVDANRRGGVEALERRPLRHRRVVEVRARRAAVAAPAEPKLTRRRARRAAPGAQRVERLGARVEIAREAEKVVHPEALR